MRQKILVLAQKALNRSKAFRWYSQFRYDDERDGRPKSTRKEVNDPAVVYLVKNNLRIASGMTAESLKFPVIVVLRILKEDLGKRKLCAAFVPYSFTPEQRED